MARNPIKQTDDPEAALRAKVAQQTPTLPNAAEEDISTLPPQASARIQSPAVRTTGVITPTRRDLSRAMDENDFTMPRINLAQMMSKVVINRQVEPGTWYHSLSRKPLGEEILIVPANFFKHRSYFIEGTVLCRSFDMVQGIGQPGIDCESCELKEWPEDRAAGGPPCSINYNYAVVATDPEMKETPVAGILTFRSTGTRTAKQLNGLHMQSFGEWWESAYLLGTSQRSNKKGTFFIPEISYLGNSEGKVREMAQALAQRTARASVQDLMESDTDSD